MFKVVKYVDPPNFFLMCDDRHCTMARIEGFPGNIPEEMPSDRQSRVNQMANNFIAAAKVEGWTIGLDAHVCPHCNQRMFAERQEQKERERKIEVATPGDLRQIERQVPVPSAKL